MDTNFSKKCQILVVDDDPAILRCIDNITAKFGCQVLCAASGKKALEIIEAAKGNIDLLLADVMIPGMSGPQLAIAFKKINPQIKIIFMSGSGNVESVMKEYTDIYGHLDYLPKPFTPEELISTIEEVMGKTRPALD